LTDQYVRLSGTSFSAPLTAAVAARYTKEYMNAHGGARPSPTQVYDFLLSNATPNVVDHVPTPASWWCASPIHYFGYTANPGVCPFDQQRDGTTPIAMPATDNTRSNAGLLYYNPVP
jgi:subtilase family serine protease